MIPRKLAKYIAERGATESHSVGQVFHAQNFDETLFMIVSGYVKRYQVTKSSKRVIESIYGPGHIFPLSQLYKRIFGVDQNQGDLVYVYQAMSDVVLVSMSDDEITEAVEADADLYKDLFYEAGLRTKSNIDRLASNALADDYEKITHQLYCLAHEFGELISSDNQNVRKILVPLTAIDVAEQLNLDVEVADEALKQLVDQKILKFVGANIVVQDLDLLRDAYLHT